MNDDDIASKTGEGAYGRDPETNEVSLNGDTGRFIYFDREQERDPETGKYKNEPLDAGVKLKFDSETGEKEITETTPLRIVFLKIRRTLSYYHPDGGSMRTAEHSTKYDKTILYGPEKGQKEAGRAEDLRAKYEDLRTVQKIYAYLPDRKEVVRLVVKGASLGSKVQSKEAVKFYDYLQTFKKDEHFWQYITEVSAVPEKGPKGIYFAMSFVRGERLAPEQEQRVKDLINDVHEQTERMDAKVRDRMASTDMVTMTDEEARDSFEEEPTVAYPDEEINPEDIPF